MEKIVDRIRKLLRLAKDKGASEAEAASALAKAQELMLQHNIDHVDDEDKPGIVQGEISPDRWDSKWHLYIANAVAELFTCRTLWNKQCNFRFVGMPLNVQAAEVTFPFVIDQIETLYKEGLNAFKQQVGKLNQQTRSDFRTTFKEACAMRVLKKAREILAARRNQIPDHMALVVIDQTMDKIDQMFSTMGTKTKSVAVRRSGFGTGAGYAAGDQVELSKDNLHNEKHKTSS